MSQQQSQVSSGGSGQFNQPMTDFEQRATHRPPMPISEDRSPESSPWCVPPRLGALFQPERHFGPGAGCRVLVVDNHDSFTFNLVQYLLELGAQVWVVENDAITTQQIRRSGLTHLLLSPGPGRPEAAGICPELCEIAVHEPFVPVLGVCLGHQALCQAHGARVVPADNVVHGKLDAIHHDQQALFRGLPNPFRATRYHSLLVETGSLPEFLLPIAHTAAGELMAVAHLDLPLYGLQFHPESIASEGGHRLLAGFLRTHLSQP